MELENFVRAGYPAIILTTPEEDRALKACSELAKKLNKEFVYWSLTGGIQNVVKNYATMTEAEIRNEATNKPKNAPSDPVVVLEDALKTKNSFSNQGKIFVLLDFHPLIKSANVWRRAKDLFKLAKTMGVTYVFVSVEFNIPPELKREVITTSLPLPTREEIRSTLETMASDFRVKLPAASENIVEAALGLTINEAENAFATSLAKYGRFDVKLINSVKEKTICSDGILEYTSSDETLENVGGMRNFTDWARKRLSAYSKEAQEYGIPYPKGTLLIGIPGCGKSLSAKALANLWQKPLLKLDVGKLFSKLVGDTEANTRKALQTAEAMAPAILWIDEIEKGLSGVQSSGKTDSGVTSRMFGTILTWMQEKKAPVFVIATANNISELPPEFLRKGRFDEIFFVDLPHPNERKEIFSIQLKKYKRSLDNFDLDKLSEATDSYTGAEIEQAIVDALFNAWDSDDKELTTEKIIEATKNINPMALGMMKSSISNMREWANKAGINTANSVPQDKSSMVNSRIILTENSEKM